MRSDQIYDVVGIGIGPFNLGLAALLAPVEKLSALFLDQSATFNWHPGMMLDDATLQVPFMADLVTMADPTSPYSFLNYLKQNDRLYKFYIRENFFVLRKEYNAYCCWVIDRLPNCHFNQKVIDITYNKGVYELTVLNQLLQTSMLIKTRKLVLGTGTSPKIPAFVNQQLHGKVIHSSAYLDNRETLLRQKDVTIIGSGQSAAEIFYDLLSATTNGLQLNWFTRPDRFFPMEYSKLTLELTSPEYVAYFYQLGEQKRKQVLGRQNPLFKGINFDLINQIFDKLYELSADGQPVNVRLSPNSQLNGIDLNADGSYQLRFSQVEQEIDFETNTNFVVMATGYAYREPAFLKGIEHRISRNESQQFDVQPNYSIDKNANEIFVQNAELHTHGFVTPDLGMGAYRNSSIINTLLGKPFYKVEKSIAFQQFSWQAEAEQAPITEGALTHVIF